MGNKTLTQLTAAELTSLLEKKDFNSLKAELKTKTKYNVRVDHIPTKTGYPIRLEARYTVEGLTSRTFKDPSSVEKYIRDKISGQLKGMVAAKKETNTVVKDGKALVEKTKDEEAKGGRPDKYKPYEPKRQS